MSADTLKSASITNLDASTLTPNTSGEGGAGILREISDFVTPTTGGLGDTTSTYRILRLASNVVLKALRLEAGAVLDSGGASAALKVDVGAYYSDSTNNDGTAPANSGVVINDNCFADARAFGTTADNVVSGIAKQGDLNVDAMSSLNRNLINSQLWKQVGLSSDPGGYIDIVVTVETAANTAVATPFALRAMFVQ
jgi:hypothetical protein